MTHSSRTVVVLTRTNVRARLLVALATVALTMFLWVGIADPGLPTVAVPSVPSAIR